MAAGAYLLPRHLGQRGTLAIGKLQAQLAIGHGHLHRRGDIAPRAAAATATSPSTLNSALRGLRDREDRHAASASGASPARPAALRRNRPKSSESFSSGKIRKPRPHPAEGHDAEALRPKRRFASVRSAMAVSRRGRIHKCGRALHHRLRIGATTLPLAVEFAAGADDEGIAADRGARLRGSGAGRLREDPGPRALRRICRWRLAAWRNCRRADRPHPSCTGTMSPKTASFTFDFSSAMA